MYLIQRADLFRMCGRFFWKVHFRKIGKFNLKNGWNCIKSWMSDDFIHSNGNETEIIICAWSPRLLEICFHSSHFMLMKLLETWVWLLIRNCHWIWKLRIWLVILLIGWEISVNVVLIYVNLRMKYFFISSGLDALSKACRKCCWKPF